MIYAYFENYATLCTRRKHYKSAETREPIKIYHRSLNKSMDYGSILSSLTIVDLLGINLFKKLEKISEPISMNIS